VFYLSLSGCYHKRLPNSQFCDFLPVRKRRTKLERHVLATIRGYEMLRPGERVAVAVSGGADSVALLRLLQDLAGELGIKLLVAHFNHALRGEESDADERFVAGLTRDAGLEFVSQGEDVGAAARRHRWNLEDAARRLRYQFFEGIVMSGRAGRVAVAHTADDQAETILGRLIRGTGISGLAGIYPVVGQVVRPLLGIRRDELRRYLEQRRQAWREDATNRDSRRLRARLRHQILPELERDFSSRVVPRLCELARLAGDEEIFWSALEEDCFRAWVTETSEGLSIHVRNLLVPLELRHAGAALPALDLRQVSRAVTRRLVRRVIAQLHGNRLGFTAQHVEQVIHLAGDSASGRRIELPGGMTVEKSFDRLVFRQAAAGTRSPRGRETVALPEAYEYVVSLPERGSATITVAELGSKFRLKVIDWPLPASDTKRAQALDADRLRGPLVLRNWRPGDAYRPRGRGRVQKLKKMFSDARIAVRERARWPVLTSAGKLVWARGMPPAGEFAAGSGTRAGLVIEEGV
jgi:tRNA(Ile)-lysidine synthase